MKDDRGLRPRIRRALIALAVGLGLVVCALSLTPIPEELTENPRSSRKIFDRSGLLLARTRGGTGDWYQPLKAADFGPHFVPALLAAEDARFFRHPGVDPLAIGRALGQLVTEGRIVSGASTITQQLARTTLPRLPPWVRKVCEAWLSVRLEFSYTKEELLELYANRVHFGPQVLGIRAAAERYFGKEPSELDLSETAALVGLVRGPSLYDLEKRPELAKRRRDRVLERMRSRRLAPPEAIERARSTPLTLFSSGPFLGAEHWVRFIQKRVVEDSVRTTIDLSLQREVERLAVGHKKRLEAYQATALSIVVLDLKSADLLAYVGSPDFRDVGGLGQNDGVRALRQPGSTLKPFLYAAAVDLLGMHEESPLSDEPEPFAAPGGHFMPVNFDRHFRGEVSLRRALSNSLNVPAVSVVEKVGPERSLKFLHGFGFESLDKPAHTYGPALALGAGEVSLLELVLGYAALGNGGLYRPAQFTLEAERAPATRACSPRAADLITRIIADRAARRESFGATQNFEFPFQVAVKTGTSTGFRDAWVLGFSHQVVVGVWVGNFDGRPMRQGSGAGTAGPLFHDTMVRSVARALELWPERRLDGERWGSPYSAGSGTSDVIPTGPRLIFPKSGMRFARGARAQGGPELVLRASSLGSDGSFLIGAQELRAGPDGTAVWIAAPGAYEIVAVRADGSRSEAASVIVE